MPNSPLFGRRIHIAGSIPEDVGIARTEDVQAARVFVQELVRELVRKGARFVIPVDAEKTRSNDGLPICFDWLIWETLSAFLDVQPKGAPDPLAIAVQHHKTEDQIPADFQKTWDKFRVSDRVQIENVSHWNMASKRMEAQAAWGDILITLGGSEGVLFLANLYHDAGKPVIPMNFPITPENLGSRRLFGLGLSALQAPKLFRAAKHTAHAWINRINFTARQSPSERVTSIISLLEDLEAPRAFAIRLLNPDHPDFMEVDAFFKTVVQPVIEGELGYKMTVVDGSQPYEHARIDQEIFTKLHRSRVVLADLTGMRPNCFLELGYAFGRTLPTLVMAKHGGTAAPFDIHTFAGLHWKTSGTLEERRQAFREHWTAVERRPPLVPTEPLIS